jgi:hypothetical protein
VVLGLTESWWSDKYNIRGPVILFNVTIEIIGISVLGFAVNPSVRYFGAFLLVGSSNANVPAALTYQGVNIVGQWNEHSAQPQLLEWEVWAELSGPWLSEVKMLLHISKFKRLFDI